MKAIIAVNNLGFIGLNGGLPWEKCPADLKHFKKLTSEGGVLIAGHRTITALPELKGREVILVPRVITNNFVEGLDKLFGYMGHPWCIGGKATYEALCHLFDEIHISYIDDNSVGDTMFPDLRNLKDGCEVHKYYF